MEARELIDDLQSMVKNHIKRVENLQNCSLEKLNHKQDEKAWSALEAVEHLNRYGAFYIPEIRKRIALAPKRSVSKFKSGWLGNYFAQSLLPKARLNKMKTFKSMNPIGSDLDKQVLQTFLSQQNQILALLNEARNVDLSKTKTNISITSWIKLRLGDTFKVVIYHNLRHIAQAERAVK